MALISQNFEGGSNGAVITTGNSGGVSGDAFTSVTNLSFSSAQAAHGILSGLASSSAAAALPTTGAASNGVGYVRMYLWVTGTTTTERVLGLNDTTGFFFGARLNASQLQLMTFNGSTSNYYTQGTTTLPANQWVRVEVAVRHAASLEARLYTTLDSFTATETITQTLGTGTDAWSSVVINTPTGSYIDDLAWTDVNWLGPVLEPPPRPISVNARAAQRASRW